MEQAEIKALLDKYWQAEASLEEERQLADYFRRPEIDPALEPLRSLFDWRAEEAELTPGEDFDRRMLERIGHHDASIGQSRMPTVPVRPLRLPSIGFAAAAAVLLCICISFLLTVSGPGPTPARNVATSASLPAVTPSHAAVHEVKDTYDDPQQALAAVRHALLIASNGISKGRHITQKNINRFHNSWQAATGD
jgi:hypothetical protein